MGKILSLLAIADLLADRRGLNADVTVPLSEIMANDWFMVCALRTVLPLSAACSLCKSLLSARGRGDVPDCNQAWRTPIRLVASPRCACLAFAEGRVCPYFCGAS